MHKLAQRHSCPGTFLVVSYALFNLRLIMHKLAQRHCCPCTFLVASYYAVQSSSNNAQTGPEAQLSLHIPCRILVRCSIFV
ncbi:hypothetical protein V5799_018626 [Amblyomma americanum]|uniref:Uncharacterized protein n=1 Tax=Amblyomma americanum TaxID=6943 RepID=A0AAQ4EZ01_AMBAM